MANESVDFKKMIYDLLGLQDGATEDMVNERYKKAMAVPADEALKKSVSKCNELETANATLKSQLSEKDTAIANAVNSKTGFEVKITDLTSAKTKAEGDFANERQARIKLIVNSAVIDGRITGADVEAVTKNLANAKDFDAEVAVLEKKEKKINRTQNSAGLNNQVKDDSQASVEFANEVKLRQKEVPTEGYTNSWAYVGKTEKGKSLLALMKQPERKQ